MDRTKKLAIISVLALIVITVGAVYSNPAFITGSIKKLTPKKTTVVVKRTVAPEKPSVFPTINTNPTTSVPVVPTSNQTIGTTATVTAEALGFDQLQALKHYTDSTAENKQIIDLLNQILTAVKNQPAPSIVYQQVPVQVSTPAPVLTPTPVVTPEPVIEPKDPLNEGLVGYWTFEEGSGAVAVDASGLGNNGTLTGDPAWVSGIKGGALSFDGQDDYVIIPDSPSLDISKSITLSFWVKPIKTTDCYSNQLMQKASSTGDSNFNIYYFGGKKEKNGEVGKVLLYANVGGPWQLVNNGLKPLNISEWNHVVFTYQSGEGILYLNGVASSTKTTVTGGLALNNEPIYIGYGLSGFTGGACGQYFNGAMDDVRIYDRVLSPEEVEKLFKLQ